MVNFRVAPRALLLVCFAAGAAARASAQALPESPISAFDGKVVVSGEVIATAGNSDDVAFFNYTDYEHNALRMIRLGVSGVYHPATWLAFVGELRSEDLGHPTPYAAYVQVRPWRKRPLDIQAGRIPPTFGAFGRRLYETGNPVIGYPLTYQYLTSLRTDSLPATADDLLRMRARGWRSSFPIGSLVPGPGIPLVSAFQWDSGVRVSWRTGPVEAAGAVTNGTLSSPRVSDDNGGKQISGRIAVTPVVGLVLGASAARGAWLSRTVAPGSAPAQRSFGGDAEYSRDHWMVRGEIVWTRWNLPLQLGPSHASSLAALGSFVEGRYRVTPRVFLAARADRLGFSDLRGDAPGTLPLPWDAPVKRIEAGFGYYLQRNLVLRATAQGNWREGGRDRNRTYVSGQVAYWF